MCVCVCIDTIHYVVYSIYGVCVWVSVLVLGTYVGVGVVMFDNTCEGICFPAYSIRYCVFVRFMRYIECVPTKLIRSLSLPLPSLRNS